METSNENQESVRRQLLALSQMSKAELVEKWRDLYGKEPPGYGPVFMRHRRLFRGAGQGDRPQVQGDVL